MGGALVLGRISIVLVSALLGGILVPPPAAIAQECSQAARVAGQCEAVTAEAAGDSVTIGATRHTPGTSAESGSVSTVTAPSSPRPRSAQPQARPLAPVLGSAQCTAVLLGRCRTSSPPRGQAPTPVRIVTPPRPPAPPSSVSELAQFRPAGSSIVVEPGEWTLPRLPTNIYSTAVEHQVSGTLLGWPMEVRFTPVGYHWDYGDGARRSHSSRGSGWGSEQFSSTSTSHVYARPGVFIVSLTVEYRASFRWTGQGAFSPVAGSISQSGGSRRVDVLEVTPVLVERGCSVSSLVEGRC